MEQELSYLSSKLSHPNLIHYHSISVEEINGNNTVRVGFSYSFLPLCLPVNFNRDINE